MKVMVFNRNEAAMNSYLLIDRKSAVLIDPGFNGEDIMAYSQLHQLTLQGILLTHGHYDHIRDLKIMDQFGDLPLYIHEADAPFLYDDHLNYAPFFNASFRLKNTWNVILLKQGQSILFADTPITFYHTPGHTAGSGIYQWGHHIFTGDTLFHLSVGRTDLATGSQKQLDASLKTFITQFSNQDCIYPGHEQSSTVGEERLKNPYLMRLIKH